MPKGVAISMGVALVGFAIFMGAHPAAMVAVATTTAAGVLRRFATFMGAGSVQISMAPVLMACAISTVALERPFAF